MIGFENFDFESAFWNFVEYSLCVERTVEISDAGVVAPSSGEGIYYAMTAGRMSAQAVNLFLQTGDARALGTARKAFMKAHGRVFWILGMMQYFWYKNDKRRERFVKMCDDPDVQRLTWEAYMNKELVKRDPLAHVKIFFKDLGHLFGLRAVER